MSFTEDIAPFYADFGCPATVAGVSVSGFLDKETPDSFSLLPSVKAVLRVPAAVSASVDNVVVVGGSSYTIAAIHDADFSSAEKLLALK